MKTPLRLRVIQAPLYPGAELNSGFLCVQFGLTYIYIDSFLVHNNDRNRSLCRPREEDHRRKTLVAA